jgi:carboxylesterase type B
MSLFRSASLVLACLAAVTAQSTAPTVTTAQGTLVGTRLLPLVNAFYNVPFAQPPIGNLAYKLPAYPPSNYTSTWNSSGPSGPQCTQPAGGATFTGQDDCLYLDIWAPASATPSSNLPVFVWVPGGGFVNTGYTPGFQMVNNSLDNGGAGVIVAYVRYRVGPQGYLALPGFSAENSPVQSSGNYGKSLALALALGQQRGSLNVTTVPLC